MFRVLVIPLLLSLLVGLTGCDIVVAALLADGTFSKKKSSSSTLPTAPPNVSYSVYVANFAAPAAATTEKGVLDSDANGGNPNPATWTLLGQGTATTIWSTIPANMNAILVQGPLTQVYNIDTFERLDSNGAVVEVPTSGNIYFNRNISNPGSASGMLDGVAATTVITDPAHIPCVFALFTQSITAARVRIWGPNQAPGDCVWSGNHELGGTDAVVVGNAAVNSTGTVFTSFVDTTNTQSFFVPFSSAGVKGGPVSVSTSASASGGISLAVDAADNLFVASNVTTGNIQLEKYISGAVTAQWSLPYIGVAAGGTNIVGRHGMAVASNVPLLSAGPGTVGTALFIAAGQGTSGSHTLTRFDDTPNLTPPPPFQGTPVWGPIALADSGSKPTTWSAVTTSGTTDVLATGDLSNGANLDLLTEDFAMGTGSVIWPTSVPPTTTSGGSTPNNGNDIGVDGQGFAYVAGFFAGANPRDSVLLRYKVLDGSGLTTMYHNGVSSGSLNFSGANEFLGVAVDSDGTTYVVGYITQANLVSTSAAPPVTSWWIGKFSPTGLVPLWTATFNFGVGNDQAVSVTISGNFIYVLGSETFTGPKTGLRVLKFVK